MLTEVPSSPASSVSSYKPKSKKNRKKDPEILTSQTSSVCGVMPEKDNAKLPSSIPSSPALCICSFKSKPKKKVKKDKGGKYLHCYCMLKSIVCYFAMKCLRYCCCYIPHPAVAKGMLLSGCHLLYAVNCLVPE